MGKGLAVAVIAALVIAGCFDSHQITPTLFTPPEGLTVTALESRSATVQPDGTLALEL